MRHFVYFLILLTLFGCKNTTDTTDTSSSVHVFDPQIPGGSITYNGDSVAGKVLNLTADNSQLEKITLNWKVPPVYKTMNYQVMIYKYKGLGFALPDPSNESAGADFYLLKSLSAETYLDQNSTDSNGDIVYSVEQGQDYTYWVYLKITANNKTKWSPGVKIEVKSKNPTDTFLMPSSANFWNNLNNSLGNDPSNINGTLFVNLYTMGYNASAVPNQGSIATAYSGNVLYYSDTPNNRVIIYTRGLAYSCDAYKTTDPETYFACTYQYSGMPLSPVGVIGQETIGTDLNDSLSGRRSCVQYESKCSQITQASSCNPDSPQNSSICEWVADSTNQNGGFCTAYKRCLTAPTKLTVADNKLFISDSGNNRIVAYYDSTDLTKTLPLKGHVRNDGTSTVQQIDKGPARVFGKKNLSDQSTYPIGKASLSNPGGVAVNGTNLYIADTDNNRVVGIKDYWSTYSCENSDSWGNLATDPGFTGGSCQFSYLLGQNTFFEKWSLKEGTDGYQQTDPGYDGIKCTSTSNSTNCESPYILYSNLCPNFTDSTSCNSNSACNWIATSQTTGTCSLRSEATLKNYLDTSNPQKPGYMMSRYFRKPNTIKFQTITDSTNTVSTYFLVSANEEASITSPLGSSQIQSRILVWTTDPFPLTDPNSIVLDKCNAGSGYNNFEVSSSKCHADFIIGQEAFNKMSVVAGSSNYNSLNYGLKSLYSFVLKDKHLFGVDSSNNTVLYWEDFTAFGTAGLGFPASVKVSNPNGSVNPNTGKYLPILQKIWDIDITSNNLIYISDPEGRRVHEIRAYNYETAQ